MKRITYTWLAGMILGLFALAAVGQNTGSTDVSQDPNAQGPSLGTYARSVRKDKKASKTTYDNDNLPMNDKISVVGDKTQAGSQAVAATMPDQAAATAPTDAPKVEPGQSQEEMQQVYSQWQGKISGQQSNVDLLSRELDVAQREYKLRQAAMYGDAGDRFRNQAAWDKEDADYKQKIAEKQKALDEAKQHMSDIQEDARKSGVPNSAIEDAQKPPSQEPQQEQ